MHVHVLLTIMTADSGSKTRSMSPECHIITTTIIGSVTNSENIVHYWIFSILIVHRTEVKVMVQLFYLWQHCTFYRDTFYVAAWYRVWLKYSVNHLISTYSAKLLWHSMNS